MHVLIIKHAALGDVVRTSYFAQPLKIKYGADLRLSWITTPVAEPLIRFNPAIDDIWLGFDEAKRYGFDLVYSLDDELSILEAVSQLKHKNLTGAYLNGIGKSSYTD